MILLPKLGRYCKVCCWFQRHIRHRPIPRSRPLLSFQDINDAAVSLPWGRQSHVWHHIQGYSLVQHSTGLYSILQIKSLSLASFDHRSRNLLCCHAANSLSEPRSLAALQPWTLQDSPRDTCTSCRPISSVRLALCGWSLDDSFYFVGWVAMKCPPAPAT